MKIKFYSLEREGKGVRLYHGLNVVVKSLPVPNFLFLPSNGFGKSIVRSCVHGLITQAPASYFCTGHTKPVIVREPCVLIIRMENNNGTETIDTEYLSGTEG